jgi:hypothetical protein
MRRTPLVLLLLVALAAPAAVPAAPPEDARVATADPCGDVGAQVRAAGRQVAADDGSRARGFDLRAAEVRSTVATGGVDAVLAHCSAVGPTPGLAGERVVRAELPDGCTVELALVEPANLAFHAPRTPRLRKLCPGASGLDETRFDHELPSDPRAVEGADVRIAVLPDAPGLSDEARRALAPGTVWRGVRVVTRTTALGDLGIVAGDEQVLVSAGGEGDAAATGEELVLR